MILFTCLLVLAIVITVLTIVIGGSVAVVFGDVIICILIIAWIIKYVTTKKKK
jgi:hypothetical protein|nr:MAG TPA: hypothetical protein [Caudoviricetes sp.]